MSNLSSHCFRGIMILIATMTAFSQQVYSQTYTTVPMQPVANPVPPMSPNPPIPFNHQISPPPAASPLPGAQGQNVEIIESPADFFYMLSQCDHITDKVVSFKADFLNGGQMWMQASKTGFCHMMIQPRDAEQPVDCDFTKDQMGSLIAPNAATLYNQAVAQKNASVLTQIVKPLIDCYNQKQATVNQPVTNQPPTNQPVVSQPAPSKPVNQTPAQQQYNYGKLLQ
jgi:hypothetical protein